MNTIYLRRVRQLFSNDLTPIHIQRRNMRHWVRSVRYLGGRHILATPVQRRLVDLGEVA